MEKPTPRPRVTPTPPRTFGVRRLAAAFSMSAPRISLTPEAFLSPHARETDPHAEGPPPISALAAFCLSPSGKFHPPRATPGRPRILECGGLPPFFRRIHPKSRAQQAKQLHRERATKALPSIAAPAQARPVRNRATFRSWPFRIGTSTPHTVRRCASLRSSIGWELKNQPRCRPVPGIRPARSARL